MSMSAGFVRATNQPEWFIVVDLFFVFVVVHFENQRALTGSRFSTSSTTSSPYNSSSFCSSSSSSFISVSSSSSPPLPPPPPPPLLLLLLLPLHLLLLLLLLLLRPLRSRRRRRHRPGGCRGYAPAQCRRRCPRTAACCRPACGRRSGWGRAPGPGPRCSPRWTVCASPRSDTRDCSGPLGQHNTRRVSSQSSLLRRPTQGL